MRLRNGLKLQSLVWLENVWCRQRVEQNVPGVMVSNQSILWWLEIRLFFVWLQQPQRINKEIVSWDSKSSSPMVASRKPVHPFPHLANGVISVPTLGTILGSGPPTCLYGTPVWCSEWLSPLETSMIYLKSSKSNVTLN